MESMRAGAVPVDVGDEIAHQDDGSHTPHTRSSRSGGHGAWVVLGLPGVPAPGPLGAMQRASQGILSTPATQKGPKLTKKVSPPLSPPSPRGTRSMAPARRRVGSRWGIFWIPGGTSDAKVLWVPLLVATWLASEELSMGVDTVFNGDTLRSVPPEPPIPAGFSSQVEAKAHSEAMELLRAQD
ncbi:hypothetical protein FDECE_10080 [Fusarium decemcellulare]|nr:hypothetical protein FDECE_10080 [Fusarium decemcellulare]